MRRSLSTAVVGAGPAGLIAARALRRAGHSVRVFERAPRVGGVWVYDEAIESDPLGVDPRRTRVHGSLYASLRTNLPRDLMALPDFPFTPQDGGDARRFPHHSEVLAYVERFARESKLDADLSLECGVERIDPAEGARWTVHTRTRDGVEASETFDAVVVCNGHYAQPRVPPIAGLERFAGRALHSHAYRTPEPFRDECALVIGAAASGRDLAIEIADVATRVDLSAEPFADPESALRRAGPGGARGNIVARAPVAEVTGPSGVLFADGERTEDIDALVFCTGFDYAFPFLAHRPDVVRVDDGMVTPLYRQIVPPDHPTLAFVGLPFLVLPFPLFEIQSTWIAEAWAGGFALPDGDARWMGMREDERLRAASDTPKRHAHQLGFAQFAYVRALAAECGAAAPGPEVEALFRKVVAIQLTRPLDYRDAPLG